MSLMALRSRYALAAVVAMAAYLPLATQAPEMSPANQHTPILLCHGDSDPTARCPESHLPGSFLLACWRGLAFHGVRCHTC